MSAARDGTAAERQDAARGGSEDAAGAREGGGGADGAEGERHIFDCEKRGLIDLEVATMR